jgi:DNA-binding beta-propeller fold protein YncE
VSVIDGTTAAVVGTVPVGPGPATLDVNLTTHLVFVALVGRPDVVVVDGTTLAVLARVVGPTGKGQVVVDAAIDNVFVADLDNDSVAVIAQGESPSLSGAPPAATVGVAYAFAFTVAGTPAPDVRVSSGARPDGLSLSSAGELTGTPTTAGSFPFEITATNSIDPAAVLAVTLEVAAPLELPRALPPTGNDSLPLLAVGVGLVGLGLAVARAGVARRPYPPKETS